ncbi:hypothetical protein CLMAG_25640 [Clostridium magnum DSM 2767]|uniref:Major facilitator superfamily (MFS) profile domain-containing protein n=1 Tax=Clostridium magnum DSM 2767 TaxID=1121326 RepID=A0A162TK70_9CLOT|nr:hypothetical protein CLMAG_25640 [Clostridium magnum DSM 2767]SHI26949.1 MFS transporter, NNP family, nitrate/nitrite transporter [Clostridium magnum DSM 2767]
MLKSISTSVTRVYGGKFADRLGGEIVSVTSLSIMLLETICMVIANLLPLAIVGILLLAAGMGVTNAAVFKILSKEAPHTIGGAADGLEDRCLGGFVTPPVMASFIDKTRANLSGFSKGFLVFSALAIMSLIILGIFRMGSKNSAATSKA